ncbi:MAG TPA: Zn-ribbon domain-containing OB-fold protein [Geobacterales bacterium]|nr:Zn-ribbon domain-containing OB-fold protein [Geobacterales bacterium]
MSQKEAFDQFLKSLDEAVKEAKRAIKLPLIPDQKTGRLLWISNRELRLRYAISVDSNKKFYEALLDGKLLATKCPTCGALYFPPQDYCNRCKKQGLQWVELSGEGELLSYTKVVVKPYSFSHLEDYIVGIAKLKEGINILAWVSEKDVSKLKRGMKVNVRVKEREEEGYLVYEIVPAQD